MSDAQQFCTECGWQGEVCELALDCWQDSMVCPKCKNKHVEFRPNHNPAEKELADARAEVERVHERYLGVCREVKKLEDENKMLREVGRAVHRYLGALNSKDKATALAELRRRLEATA